MIVDLKDQILILLQLGNGDISYLHMSLHLRSLLTHLQTFYKEVKNFTKNEDKFGWVKYWRMTFNSPNSPNFSPATILRYTVYHYAISRAHNREGLVAIFIEKVKHRRVNFQLRV